MNRTTISISVEQDVFELFSNAVGRGSVSRSINDFMRDYTKGKADISIEMAKSELESVKRQLINLTVTKAQLEKTIKESEQDALKKHQEAKDLEERLRWICPICMMKKRQVLNLMDDLRCKECGLPVRDDKNTQKTHIEKVI